MPRTWLLGVEVEKLESCLCQRCQGAHVMPDTSTPHAGATQPRFGDAPEQLRNMDFNLSVSIQKVNNSKVAYFIYIE
jgi:hypothetical protein